jgi:hypothetical protein
MNKRWKTGSILVLIMMLVGISSAWAKKGGGGGGSCGHGKQTVCVPEIDSTGALPALTLLGGILAVINERRRRK